MRFFYLRIALVFIVAAAATIAYSYYQVYMMVFGDIAGFLLPVHMSFTIVILIVFLLTWQVFQIIDQ